MGARALAKDAQKAIDGVKSEFERKLERQQVRRQADQERLDGLLEKIHSQGLGSLSGGEKEFLKRVSRKG